MEKMLKNPVACGVFITRKCDLRCEYCNIPMEDSLNELSVDEWKKAVRILEKLGVKTINFLGGEPTLYSGIEKIISFIANETELTCSIVTNANGGNRYRKINDLISAGLNRISVSIDNLIYDNSISPLKSKNGLELVEYIEREGYLKNSLFSVRNYCVINNNNLLELVDLVNYFSKKKIHTYFLPYHWSEENIYEHRKTLSSFAITSNESLEILKIQCQKLIEMKKEGVLLDNSFEFFECLPKYIRKLNWHCTRLSEIRIDYNGKMMCCCDRKGTVYNDFTIFELEDEAIFKKFLKQRHADSIQCKGCMWSSSFEFEVESKKIYDEMCE